MGLIPDVLDAARGRIVEAWDQNGDPDRLLVAPAAYEAILRCQVVAGGAQGNGEDLIVLGLRLGTSSELDGDQVEVL